MPETTTMTTTIPAESAVQPLPESIRDRVDKLLAKGTHPRRVAQIYERLLQAQATKAGIPRNSSKGLLRAVKTYLDSTALSPPLVNGDFQVWVFYRACWVPARCAVVDGAPIVLHQSSRIRIDPARCRAYILYAEYRAVDVSHAMRFLEKVGFAPGDILAMPVPPEGKK